MLLSKNVVIIVQVSGRVLNLSVLNAFDTWDSHIFSTWKEKSLLNNCVFVFVINLLLPKFVASPLCYTVNIYFIYACVKERMLLIYNLGLFLFL
jgi:hypothetical protein